MKKLLALFLFSIFHYPLSIIHCSAQCSTVSYPGNFIVSANTTLGGIHNVVDTFRVELGVTLTVEPKSAGCGYLEVNANVIQIFGTIDGNGSGDVGGTGGGPGGCWADDGNTDCRGIAFCWDKDNCHQLRADGGAAGTIGAGTGGGNAGSNGSNAYGNKQECFAFDDDSGRNGGAGGAGGGNGGCHAGSGGSSATGGNGSGTSGCSGDASCSTTGGAGAVGGSASVSACVLYGSLNSYAIDMGSGGGAAGGGGRGYTAGLVGGNGGSGGAYVKIISSGDMFVTGAIYVNGANGGTGGNGGNAGNANGSCCNDGSPDCDEETYIGAGGGGGGAGGGSGGGILLDAQCGSMIVSGILEAKGANGGLGGNGGAASSQAGAGGTGAIGGGGGGGRIKIFTNTCGANNISSTPDASGGFGLINGTAGTYYTGTNAVVLTAGSVGNNQTICNGATPDTLLNTASASIGACTGFNYQWQSAPSAAGPWTNIPGATSATCAPTVISATTFYRRIVTAGNCTDSTNVLTVTATPSPLAVISGNTTICSGSVATLTASGGINYSWSTGATSAVITDNPTVNTSYTVLVTDAGGCSDTATATVNIVALPVPAISGNNTICSGTPILLTASGGGTYSWSNGVTASSISVTPSSNTTYSVTVSSGGCSASASILVSVVSSPVASVSGNATICAGQTTSLIASGGGTYSWSNGSTGSMVSLSPSANTTYSVIVSLGNCSDTASISITVNPIPVAFASPGSSAICAGENVILTASGGGNYLWNPGGQTNAVISVSPNIFTIYTVIVSLGSCYDTASASVTVNPLPSANAGADVTINYGDEIVLSASGGVSYVWNTGETTVSLSVSPTSTTSYTVVVTDANGCTDASVVTVYVEFNCGDLFIPNAFSPNGDLQNDVLYVRSSCLKTMHFVVYNRWGLIVFETNEITRGWDGTKDGKKQNTGVYVYSLSYELISSESGTKKGNVSLIK